jgi:hypothetical protein
MFFNRSILASILAVGLFPVVPFSATTTEPPPSITVALNRVTYQMSEQTVFQKLGQPQKTGQTTDSCSGATHTRLFYPGMTVDIEEFQGKQRLVQSIVVTGRNLGIDRGVKIGDPISKAKKTYKKIINKDPNRSDTWNVVPPYSEVFLAFVVNRADKITKISLGTSC